ncbi:MAG: cell division protein FtsA [Patescibacteria group bacterium]
MLGRKPKSTLIAGLDIGQTAVRVVVGKLVSGSGLGQPELQIVGMTEVPSEGVNRGIITSIEESVSAISHALEQTERQVGAPIEHAWVGISGPHIQSQESRGVVAVAKSDGEIGYEDIERALEAARTVATPLNSEILHVLPRSYSVDGQTGIKDPVGMTGIRLEVDTQIIQGAAAQIKNLTKAVYRTGIDIDDLVFSILAAGEAVITPRQKELGVCVVNIGGATTGLIVYEEGDVVHTAVLPVGSSHVTNDLAIGLRSSIDVAERVKKEYGECAARDFSKKDVIDLATVGADFKEEVLRKDVADYISARMEEILEKVDQELIKINRSRLLPAGIVFTGGGSKISGLIELAKDKLGLPASLGYPLGLKSVSDKINDLSFVTAVGLVKWGAHLQQGGARRRGLSAKTLERVSKRVKEWFKSLVP